MSWPSPAPPGADQPRPHPLRADALAGRLPDAAWHRQSAGAEAKGPRFYDWAWIQTGTGDHRHLLIRRNPATGRLAFDLYWSPTDVALSELVRVAGTRWCVEKCFQAAQGQVGLDQDYWASLESWASPILRMTGSGSRLKRRTSSLDDRLVVAGYAMAATMVRVSAMVSKATGTPCSKRHTWVKRAVIALPVSRRRP
jgi:hypothetical protein